MALTQVDQGMLGTNAQYTGFKNRLINSAMVIDQRNAGASVTLAGGGTYTVDRWQGYEDSDGVMTAQQDSSAPTGFINSLKFTTTTADASLASTQFVLIQQKIEGFNITDLAWGTASAATVTLSFWVRSSLTGTFGGALRNSAQNRSYPFTYTISAVDTWEQKSVTIAGDTTGTWLTTNGIGIQICFSLGVGSTYSGTAGSWSASQYFSATGATSVIGTLNATFHITGVQLEKGSTATSFDYRPYGTELALCQRYYWRFDGAHGNGTYSFCSGSIYGATTTLRAYLKYPVTMRSGPTLSYAGTITGSGGSNDNAVSAIATQLTGLDAALVDFTVAAGTIGQGKIVYVPSAAFGTNYIQGTSEL